MELSELEIALFKSFFFFCVHSFANLYYLLTTHLYFKMKDDQIYLDPLIRLISFLFCLLSFEFFFLRFPVS